MDEDRLRVVDPDQAVDPASYATGDGTYVRKPRVRSRSRQMPVGLVVLVASMVCAGALAGVHWYALRSDEPVVRSGDNASAVVIDLPNSLAKGGRNCDYLAFDKKTKVDLPAPVDRAVARLVLQTDKGRLVVVLNGWAGLCATKSVQSLAIAHRFDRMQCISMWGSKALVCFAKAGYVYQPSLVDPRALAASAAAQISEDGTVHLVVSQAAPRADSVSKRRGLLTLYADLDGYAGGDLVLVYGDTTLPGGAYYPTVGEIEDEDGVLDRIANGVRVLSATVE